MTLKAKEPDICEGQEVSTPDTANTPPSSTDTGSSVQIKSITTPTGSQVRDTVRENPIHTPDSEVGASLAEKVSGLETLAAAGLPTPKHRLYLDASYFESSDEKRTALSKKVQTFADGLKKPKPGEGKRIMVRSAHRREHEFSGGAFQSKQTEIYSNSEVIKVMKARDEIIKKSDPKNAPHVQRDINLRDIADFEVNDMGVYLNEEIPSIRQITVIPLDNGEISLRYFNNDLLIAENVDPAVNPREGIHILVPDNRGRKIPIMVDRTALIDDIKKAQACFDTPQEFEIQITRDGETENAKWVFVQAKSVTPESTQNDDIPEQPFEDGLKSYHPNFPYGHQYTIMRASERDILRNTQVVIIDEDQWIKDWILENMPDEKRFDNEYIFDAYKEKFGSYFNLQKFVAAKKEVYQAIMAKYQELIQMATHMKMMTIVKKKTAISFDNYAWEEYKKDPKIKAIIEARETLSSLASVLFQGTSAGDNDVSKDHHTVIGSGGLAQILIRYRMDESRRGDTNDNWQTVDRFKNLKNGDALIVMIKKGEASLYVPEA